MNNNLATIIGVLGSAFTLLVTLLKLRQEMDERRDVALGLKKENQDIPKEIRLHILEKDVWERCVTMVLLTASVGLAWAGYAFYISNNGTVNRYLKTVLFLFGLLWLVGSGFTLVRGRKAREKYEAYILTGVWEGKELRTENETL